MKLLKLKINVIFLGDILGIRFTCREEGRRTIIIFLLFSDKWPSRKFFINCKNIRSE